MSVDRSTAKRIIDELCDIQSVIHQPVPQGLPELSDLEMARLKRIMGLAIGTIYTDLMVPAIQVYPDLDPDRDDASPRRTVRSLDTVGPSREEFAQRLARACRLACDRLDKLCHIIEVEHSHSEGKSLTMASSGAKRHLAELMDFARQLMPDA